MGTEIWYADLVNIDASPVPAVRMDLFDVAVTLISRGASVNQHCLKKWTAVHEAAKVGCTDILQLLLAHGGNISETDQHGVTPMAVAAEYGQTEVLEILIQNGKCWQYAEIN